MVSITGKSQGQILSSNPFPAKQGSLFSAGFGLTFPSGDLANRFGMNQSIEAAYKYKTLSNWTFGVQYNWLFGNNVKELTMLDSLIGASGEIIDKDGVFSVLRISQRGHMGFVTAGKILPFKSVNKNSGLYLEAGIGALIHKIDIMAPPATVPQLNGEYAKGYDRLTGGWAFKQFIGYQNLSPDRRTNFIAGVEFIQSPSNSLRAYQFDLMGQDLNDRLDLITQLKIAIILPVYTKKAGDEEYFFD